VTQVKSAFVKTDKYCCASHH